MTAGGLVAAAVVLFATFIVLTTVAFTVLSHSPVPKMDEWDSLELFGRILRQGTAWPDLFEPHNEHRLFFPRLVLFSDYLFFGGRGVFDQTVIVAIQSLHLALFVWLIARSVAGRAARWALAGVVAVLLFSLVQSENFDWAFQVQFVGVFACASLCCTLFAFGLAAERAGRPAGRSIGAAFLLALVDTFTMANGILAAPVLVILACLVRARLRVILAAAAVGAALMLLFSLGYQIDENHPSTLSLIRNAPNELAFAAGYLARLTPFGLHGKVAFGAAGAAALLGMAAAEWKAGGVRPVRLALLGIAVFAAGSAAMTALGRASHGLGEIEASRYATGAAVFWSALLVAGWTLPRDGLSRGIARAAVAATALLLLFSCGVAQMRSGRDAERQASFYGRLGDAMLLGLTDVPTLEGYQESVFMIRLETPFLRSRSLSIFGTGDAGLIGRPLSEVAGSQAASMTCAGGFALARARPDLGPDGVAVSGSTRLRSHFGRPVRIYVVDGARNIVGLAWTGFGEDPWQGYARAPTGADLTAYALSDGGRLCRLGSAVVAPPA